MSQWRAAALGVALAALTGIAAQPYAPAKGCDDWLNAWCDGNCPHAEAHGPLLARKDTNEDMYPPAWRCYARSTLSVDTLQYASGSTYCTRDEMLRDELQECLAAQKHGGRRSSEARSSPQQPAAAAAAPEQCEDGASEGPASATSVAPAGPKPPRAALDPAAKYLLFAVSSHEQLNKQRRALFYYMRLARQLGRTLVVPRVHLLRKNPGAWQPRSRPGSPRGQWFVADANEYVRMSHVYNLTRMAEYVPTVELSDLWPLDDAPGGERVGEAGEAEAQPTLDVMFVANAGPRDTCTEADDVEHEFNGVRGVLVKRRRCGLAVGAGQLGEYKQARTIAYSNVFDQVPEGQGKPFVPYLHFVDSIYDAARAFVQRELGDQRFIAVHWRRADFKITRSTRDDVLLDAEALVARVRGVMQQSGIQRVYLATDATDEDGLDILRDELGVVRYSWVSNPDESDLQKAITVANIEIAICAMAAYFLGTRTSNFSLTIREERSNLGKGDETNEFLAGPPRGDP